METSSPIEYTLPYMAGTRNTPKEALEEAFRALRPFSESDRWEFESHLRHIEFVLKALQTRQQATVIDVGCYIGIVPLALRILGVDVVGNDKYIFYPKEKGKAYGFSEQELGVLKQVWKKYGLHIDAHDVGKSLPEKEYDIVLSIATIEHQPYPKQFLEGVASFAKHGGIVYVATPNIAKFANRLRFLLGRPPMNNLEEFYANAHHFNGHWREYTCVELSTMARLSGLSVQSCKAWQMEPVKLKWRSPRKWARGIARLCARVVPGTGDINVLIARKV